MECYWESVKLYILTVTRKHTQSPMITESAKLGEKSDPLGIMREIKMNFYH